MFDRSKFVNFFIFFCSFHIRALTFFAWNANNVVNRSFEAKQSYRAEWHRMTNVIHRRLFHTVELMPLVAVALLLLKHFMWYSSPNQTTPTDIDEKATPSLRPNQLSDNTSEKRGKFRLTAVFFCRIRLVHIYIFRDARRWHGAATLYPVCLRLRCLGERANINDIWRDLFPFFFSSHLSALLRAGEFFLRPRRCSTSRNWIIGVNVCSLSLSGEARAESQHGAVSAGLKGWWIHRRWTVM